VREPPHHATNPAVRISKQNPSWRDSHHNGLVYLTGQVGTPGKTASEQTKEVLEKIEALLAQAGTDKTRILHVTLWLDDLAYFREVNAIWDEWMPRECAPARSTGQVKLAADGLLVEMTVTAAA
jgi:enamine deaminase RidA (YjgF/YER057c/UK114 family)